MTDSDRFITESDVTQQIEWSRNVFGHGKRTEGLIKHIVRELKEIKDNPEDADEWIDVLILALDGIQRLGYTPNAIAKAYRAKMAVNYKRQWPDFRQFTEDDPIEHIRET